MYEFLKKLFGTTEDGQPEALTFDQLSAKIEADTGLKLVDLSEGGYVAKSKLDAKITELEGVQQQLTDANATIKSYEDMDVEGIKKSVADWQKKYEDDTKALQDQLATQETEFAARTYLGGFEYTNDLVRDAIYTKFMEKGFKREGDKFLGADEFMAEMQKAYPTGFVTHDPDPAPAEDPAPGQPKPEFAPKTPPAPPAKKRSLLEMMKYHNEHPDAQINFD